MPTIRPLPATPPFPQATPLESRPLDMSRLAIMTVPISQDERNVLTAWRRIAVDADVIAKIDGLLAS